MHGMDSQPTVPSQAIELTVYNIIVILCYVNMLL